MTLAGLSRVNVENVLAVTSAALALGLGPRRSRTGCAPSSPAADNPGRMNVWTMPATGGGTVSVVVDLAHNEAGLEALLEIMNGIRPTGWAAAARGGHGRGPRRRRLRPAGRAGRPRRRRGRDRPQERVPAGPADDRARGPDPRGRGSRRYGDRRGARRRAELPPSLVAQAGDGDVVAIMAHQDRRRARPGMGWWVRAPAQETRRKSCGPKVLGGNVRDGSAQMWGSGSCCWGCWPLAW